jgi:hypothetical protein
MMFFKDEDLSELMTCPSCNIEFGDPRILACGETICNNCVAAMYDAEKKGIHCKYCNTFHKMPLEKVAQNKFLARLIKKQPCEITRGQMAKDLGLQLRVIYNKTKEFEKERYTDKEKIKEYCDFIRNNINEVTRDAQACLERYKISFIDQVKQYQAESQSRLEKEVDSNDHIDEFIENLYFFHAKWIEYLKKITLDEIKLSEASQEAHECIENLGRKINQLKEKTFKGDILRFHPNPEKIDSRILGTLIFKKKSYLTKDFNEIKKIDIPIKDFDQDKRIDVKCFDDSLLVFCTENKQENLNLYLVNCEGVILKTKELFLGSTLMLDLKLANNREYLYLYVAFNGSYFDISSFGINYYYLIKRFDEDLNFLNEIHLKFTICSLNVYSQNLYCLSNENSDCNKLYVYDKRLFHNEKIGQSNPKLPYYFSLKIQKMETSEDFHFLLEKDESNYEIKLMRRCDGIVQKRIEIFCEDFKIYLGKYVVNWCENSQELFFYEFDGTLVYKKKVELNEKGLRLITDNQTNILFFDQKSLVVWD